MMGKRKKIGKWMVFGIMLFLAASMSLQAAASGKSTAQTKEKKKTETTSLKDAQAEKKELEKELEQTKQTIQNLKESKGDVEAKVKELNGRLISISARITELENQLVQKSEEITAAKEELQAAKERERQQYEDMKVRIQFMYENSQMSYIDALFESEDIAEFMNTAEYISQIQSYDRQKLDEYSQTVQEITDLEAQLEKDYADLEQMKASVEQDKATVAAMMQEKETELAGIADDIASAQDEADYYAAEIQAQEEVIAAIKRAEAEKAAAAKKDTYSGGKFVWPCPSSSRITSDYGKRTSPTSGASSNHKGIDVGADYGAAIVAAAAGTVRAATYSSAAGNYVMIDHGGGLYTVYMHACALYVSTGQKVSAGQKIAGVGSTGISTGNHLHFGVSLNGSYVNPWGYL